MTFCFKRALQTNTSFGVGDHRMWSPYAECMQFAISLLHPSGYKDVLVLRTRFGGSFRFALGLKIPLKMGR